APRREGRQEVAGTISSRTTRGGGLGTDFELGRELIPSHDPACTLTARDYKGPLPEADLSTVVTHTLGGEGFDASEDGTGRGVPLVPMAFAQNTRDELRYINGDGSIADALAAEPGMKQSSYIAYGFQSGTRRKGR